MAPNRAQGLLLEKYRETLSQTHKQA